MRSQRQREIGSRSSSRIDIEMEIASQIGSRNGNRSGNRINPKHISSQLGLSLPREPLLAAALPNH